MCVFCDKKIDKVWSRLQTEKKYRTPDLRRGKDFYITSISIKEINIKHQTKSITSITKASFLATLYYLCQHNHDINNPIKIHSSNSSRKAGPLCQASRNKNSNVRCINYILPILKDFQIVDINSFRPNKTWLI
jgi:hypothetical protein